MIMPEERSATPQPLMKDVLSLMLYVLTLSIVLVAGLSMVQFNGVTKNNTFLEDTAFETFNEASASVVKAYAMPFYAELKHILPVLTSFTLRSITEGQKRSTEEWHLWWIERILITQKLKPMETLFRITVYLPEGLLLSQRVDPWSFTVVNFSSNASATYNVTSIAPLTLRLLQVTSPQVALQAQWAKMWMKTPRDLQVVLDTDNELMIVTGTRFSDQLGTHRGLLVGTTAFSMLRSIIQPMQFPFSQTIDITLVTREAEVLATTHTKIPVECSAGTPFAKCFSIDNNVTIRCVHTVTSFASIYSLPHEIITAFPNLYASIPATDANIELAQIFQVRSPGFQFHDKFGHSFLISLPATFGVISLFTAPSDIVLQDYSELMAATARTVVAVAIVFGVVMALVQFGVLVAVRRLVSKMMDACTNALDGVVKGHETGGAEKAPATFLSYFHETSRIVEANAALNKLVGDLMAALPSKEAPSALRRVRGQPDATGNPLAPPSAASSTQSTRDAPGENVASMLLFHIGTLSLLHRDDERSYCDIMSNALTIVHECGGVLERVAGGHFVASFNCHWPCERHAEVAAHAALKIHHLMQTHLAATPYGPGQSSTLFQGMAVGTEYCVIVDCAPFALHEFEEVGRTPEKTMRSSVVQSSSDELMMKLAPLVSALRFRVVVTSEVAHRIDIATCVIDSVESKERSLRLYEICDDDRISEIDQAMIVRGFAEMHGGRYEEALEYWRRNKPSEYRRGDRLEKVCEDMVRMKRTGAAPPVPYRRRETLPWEQFAAVCENELSLNM